MRYKCITCIKKQKTKNEKTLCWMQYKVYWHILKKKSAKKIAWGILKLYSSLHVSYEQSKQRSCTCTYNMYYYRYSL